VSIDIDPRYVNTMGTTKLALITSRDKDNDALTSNADHSFLFSTATAAASAAPYLQVYYGSAISITTNPSSQWVLLGSSVTLSAAADFGDTYKWQYSDTSGSFWNDIAGSSGSSNSSNYTFTTTSGDDRRMYRCVFEDVAGEEPAQGTSAATIRLYYGEKSSVVDRGFEGRQDGDAIDSTIWTNYSPQESTIQG
jgi:hypothetical protein